MRRGKKSRGTEGDVWESVTVWQVCGQQDLNASLLTGHPDVFLHAPHSVAEQ